MKRRLAGGVAVVAAAIVAGCSGSTSGGEVDFTDVTADNTTTGRIELDVVRERFQVGGTSGYQVFVYNSLNQPVSNIGITCDTEAGLGLLEPTSGSALTDGFGSFSGMIGCEARGSFQMACRLPTGANKRVYSTIVCDGDAPLGFDGFPESGGGGLGGGSVQPGIPDGALRIVEINSIDATGEPSSQIDTGSSVCPGGEPESYTDDTVQFTVQNDSSLPVRFNAFRYRARTAINGALVAESPRLGLIGESSAVEGTAVSFGAVFTDAESPNKLFAGTSTAIPTGTLNITFTLIGETVDGETVEVSAQVALQADNYLVGC